MIRVCASRFASLRLLLAVMVMLAGLAGARMQGQMGASAVLSLALGGGVLCSGSAMPDAGEESSTAAHDHCISCNLPVATGANVPFVALSFAWSPACHHAASVAGITLARIVSYQSRAPPSAV